MDPNKALLTVLAGLGIIVIIIVLGLAGVMPFLESPADCKEDSCNASIENASQSETSASIEEEKTPVEEVSAPPGPKTEPAQPQQPAPVPPQPEPAKPQAPASAVPIQPKPAPTPAPVPPQPPARRGLPEIGFYSFDKAEQGALPTGWSIIRGAWKAQEDAKALSGTGKNVLHQFEIPKEASDAIVISNDSLLKNVRVATNVRVSNVRTNQTAGIIFRFQDPDHYYSAGLDTKNQQVVLYKTIAGVTRVLAYQGTNRIRPNEWHYLEATATGEHIKVRLNEDDYISIKDYSFTDGKSGLWTMGSTDAYFDNAEVRKLP